MPDTKPPIPHDDPPSYTATTNPATALPTHPKPAPIPRPALDIPVLTSLRTKRVILASASPRRRALLSTLHLPNLEVHPSAFAEDLPKASLSPFEYVLQTATQKALATYRAQLNHPAGDPDLILAADTVVVARDGAILEKPRSARHHMEMLRALRDGTPVASATGLQGGGIGAAAGREHDALVGAGIRGEGAVQAPVEGRGGAGGGGATIDAAQGAWHRVFTAVAVLAPLAEARDPGYVLETAVEETAVQFDGGVTDAMLQAYVRTREGADKAGGYGIQGLGGLLVRKIDGCWDNVVGLPLRATLKLIEKVVAAAEAEGVDEEDGSGGDDEG